MTELLAQVLLVYFTVCWCEVSAIPCVVSTCNYSPDVARADCDGRSLRCIPTNFPSADTIDLRQNEITRLSVSAFAGYSRLQNIDLSNNKIFSIEDRAFVGLRGLRSLLLSFNRINRLEITTFRGLWGLQVLHIKGNSINSVHPNAFTGLPMLKELNLAGNRLSDLPGPVFQPLTNLNRLFLQDNQLMSTNTNYLVGLSQLIELDLDGNRFTALPNFSGLVRLGDLDVTDTFISVIPNNSFNGLGHVSDLVLSSNKIETVEPAAFVGLRNITDLDMSFNLIASLHEDTFLPMLGIERLALNNNMLTTLNPKTFALLYRLRTLILDNNHLKKFPPLYGLRSLRVLSVKSNYLASFDQTTLRSMPALTKLLLSGNPLQCDCRLRTLSEWFSIPPLRHLPHEIPVCDIPVSIRGRRLTQLQRSELSCTAPTILYTSGREINSLTGQNITLQCAAQGFPMPDILWYAPDRALINTEGVNADKFVILDNGRLIITRTTVADRGEYRCVARNPAGQDGKAVRLLVRPPLTVKPGSKPTKPAVAPTKPRQPTSGTRVDRTTGIAIGRVTRSPTITADLPRGPNGSGALGPSKPKNPSPRSESPGTEPNRPETETHSKLPGRPHTPLSPKLPGRDSFDQPTTEDNNVVRVPDDTCHTEPARVAVAALTTFIITSILAFGVFWMWHHRIIHKFLKHGKRRVTIMSLRRRLSSKRPRHIVPVHLRSPRAYSTVENTFNNLRSSSFSSDTEDSLSTTSSYETNNRYVITESADPDTLKGKTHARRHAVIDAFRKSTDSRHTYQNAAMVIHDPNYSALWPGMGRSKDKVRITNASADSRIYMDLS